MNFYQTTLVENKAFLDVFRSDKMGKAFLSVKRAFSSGVFAVLNSGGPPMGTARVVSG
jgi:hypothetical protein